MSRLSFISLCITILAVSGYGYSVYDSEDDISPNANSLFRSESSTAERIIGQKEELKQFYEVNAFGPLFTDFGAETGNNGAFSWHASYPVRKRKQRTQNRGRNKE